jgi:hypothetical protein
VRNLLVAVTLGVLLVSPTPARAELIDYGGGLIYDTVQDLTWLDPYFAQPPHEIVSRPPCGSFSCDWNYTWPGATEWVGNLSYEGYDDWRLPHKVVRDFFTGDNEYRIMLSQLGWEFIDVPNAPEVVRVGGHGPFLAELEYYHYWMDHLYTYTTPAAGGGYDFPDDTEDLRNVIAVRNGRPHHPVPEPSTLALFGLAGMVVAAKRACERRDERRRGI